MKPIALVLLLVLASCASTTEPVKTAAPRCHDCHTLTPTARLVP